MFSKITLDIKENLFNELLESVNFDAVAKGRMGNHLVKEDEQGVPIVRTTTKYNKAANTFSDLHCRLVDCINATLEGIPVQHFNNALTEVYDRTYTKMGFHSDQALDLDPHSYIGVFSCYERPAEHVRQLIVQDKVSGEESAYAMTHNSVVLFSVENNTRFLHKIVLDGAANSNNRWLGITFRVSKTYIQFEGDVARFADGEVLTLATDVQEKEFYRLRGEENRSLGFRYPELRYTINKADMIRPEKFK
ncbi:hypothetical protein [Chitinophaga silvisoli]|uniref:Alpha-ketoglutarate-dependent dioxygenase AlkB-like domain-containing protein n=1 Tax=Chitinophaga silvisoli TaxID=2291814 RepID=A0A3E1NX83_9BACT|nr:hypothetical protein [Chitinophaga silvisoli]RFM32539.1 hypothetical protein DXN04_22920 [Chitinophaga silvisoli]